MIQCGLMFIIKFKIVEVHIYYTILLIIQEFYIIIVCGQFNIKVPCWFAVVW